MARVLAWLAGADLARDIYGDLHEERLRKADRSRVGAALWFWRAAFSIAVVLMVGQVTQSILRPHGLRPSGGVDELRQAVRSLRRTPWYSLTVIGVAALSISLAATVFAIVDGVLFKPLPFPHADELYEASGPNGFALSLRDIQEWVAAVPEAELAAVQGVSKLGSIGTNQLVSVYAAGIGKSFFHVVGGSPLIGGFTLDQFEPTNGPVPVLISYRLWQTDFGGDVSVRGRALAISGATDFMGHALPGLTVAGVLRPDFVFPDTRGTPDVLLPVALSAEHAADRNWTAAMVVLRVPIALPAGVLQQRLDAVAAGQGFPRATQGNPESPHVGIWSLPQLLRRGTTDNFRLAFGVAALLVVLAGVNMASLGVARRRQRLREFAVRQALGAGRARLIRLALLETAPLVGAGTGIGLLVAPLLLRVVTNVMPTSMVLLKSPEVDWRVAGFTALVAAAVLAIATSAAHRHLPASTLAAAVGRGDTTTPRRGRFAFAMIAVQVALTLVLTVPGTLLLGSLWLAWSQSPGYDVDRTLVLDVKLNGTLEDRTSRLRAFTDACRAIPGVEALAVLGAPFMERSSLSPAIRRPVGARPGSEEALPVAGDFFSLMDIRPTAGRLPTTDELDQRAPVVVVSELAAKMLWPAAQAVGQTLVSARGDYTWSVIGVVPDARYGTLKYDDRGGQIYRPFDGFLYSKVLVRTRGSSARTLEETLRLGQQVSGLYIVRAMTMSDALGESIRDDRFRARVFGGFAAAALVIATVGILGLIAMSSARRTREMGVRLALGASRQRVVRLLYREQMAAVGSGILAGCTAAWWIAGLLKRDLYQFTPHDPRLWSIAIAAIVSAAATGTLIAALRSCRVDPVEALKAE
jgi:putative ABC transport system permease protein